MTHREPAHRTSPTPPGARESRAPVRESRAPVRPDVRESCAAVHESCTPAREAPVRAPEPPWWGAPVSAPVPALPWTTGTGGGLPSRRPLPPPAASSRPAVPPGAGALVVALAVAVVVAVAVLVPVLVPVLGPAAVRGTVAGPAVTTPFLTYRAPPGWGVAPPDPASADVPALVGVVHGPGYACGGEELVRGYAAAALLPVGPAGPADRAERVARWFAAASFSAADGTPPDVIVTPPRPVRVPGPEGAVEGTVTDATVRAPEPGTRGGGPAAGGCAARTGRVSVLAAPTDGGVALLLVAADTGGGPPLPAPPEPAALDAVLDSARLGPP